MHVRYSAAVLSHVKGRIGWLCLLCLCVGHVQLPVTPELRDAFFFRGLRFQVWSRRPEVRLLVDMVTHQVDSWDGWNVDFHLSDRGLITRVLDGCASGGGEPGGPGHAPQQLRRQGSTAGAHTKLARTHITPSLAVVLPSSPNGVCGLWIECDIGPWPCVVVQVLLAKGVLSFRPLFDAAAFKVRLPTLPPHLAHALHTLTDATPSPSPSCVDIARQPCLDP